MNHRARVVCVIIIIALAATPEILAQRGGRGGGGRGGFGGYGGGGFTRPATAAYGASQLPAGRTSGTGPNGGSWQTGKGGGSYTTQRGGTIEYKGVGAGGTTAGGTTVGRGAGAVQITTAGGQEITKVGRAGGATGPGGNTVARGGSITGTTGPHGSGVAASRGAVASGPGGMAAYRGGVAIGPGGAVAGRTAVAATPHGTYYRSAAAISGQGVYVRAGCAGYHGYFTSAWYGRYPGAWFPGKWTAAAAWTAATWATCAAFSGSGGGGSYPEEPVSYDYGATAVVQDDSVYVNGENVGTTEQYTEQAAAIAETGKKADPPKDDEWLPLGVFAMVQGEEKTSNNIFQLAMNRDGVIRGNYYNAVTDTTEPVYGSVDKKTQRAAWTVGETKKPVYEAGIVNLTKEDTTIMVHYSKDRSQQCTLYRVEQPKDEASKQETK